MVSENIPRNSEGDTKHILLDFICKLEINTLFYFKQLIIVNK